MAFRVSPLTSMLLTLTFCLGLASCNKEDFYEKEFLENPFQGPTTTGTVNGGGHGGIDSGMDDGGTQGGVDSGVDGGTAGGTTGSSSGGSDDGNSTGGTTAGGSADGDDGSTTPVEYVQESESFHQSATESKNLDIVWIIDNSGSMSDEQTALGTNFSAFIDEFITKDVNFKMAITTTDTSSSSKKGLMVSGSNTKLTSAKAKENESKFKSDFRSLVKVGLSGSGSEKGLEASEGFMQRYASSFLRPDAYLAVVIVSDEEDQSPKSVKAYTDYLKSFKSEAGLVKVYSIVDVTLSNKGSGVKTGFKRYADASSNTAGTVADIRDDFHRSLSNMGDSLINLLDSFALANIPVANSLKVYVDGIESSDYTYDASSNSIKFNPNQLPSVGATIKVTYLHQK